LILAALLLLSAAGCSPRPVSAKEALFMLFGDDGGGGLVYPEGYGGCYTDDDGVLYVKVIEGYDDLMQLVEDTIPADFHFEFKEIQEKPSLHALAYEIGKVWPQPWLMGWGVGESYGEPRRQVVSVMVGEKYLDAAVALREERYTAHKEYIELSYGIAELH